MSAPPSRCATPTAFEPRWRQAPRAVQGLAGPMCGFALLLLFWQLAAYAAAGVPDPFATLLAAFQLFANPFHDYGGHDIGIGWNIAASLQKLWGAYLLAVAVGLPAGLLLGRVRMLSAVSMPVISLLRPVSPLAWLPFGLLVFNTQQGAATWAIFICSLWPVLLNTAEGIRRVPRDYVHVGKVLSLSEWRIFTKILLPCALPQMLNGARLALSAAWVVTVAAEMFIGGRGIGSWLRHELVSLNGQNIVIAILVIGGLGLLQDLPALALKRKLDQRKA
jgi:nitrate/nitrite transport system permease protein